MIMIVIMMILMMKVGFKVVILMVSLTNVIILANMKYEDYDGGDGVMMINMMIILNIL